MKALVLSNAFHSEGLSRLARDSQVDLILSLGQLAPSVLRELDSLPHLPKIGVDSATDKEYMLRYGIVNVEGSSMLLSGTTFAGQKASGDYLECDILLANRSSLPEGSPERAPRLVLCSQPYAARAHDVPRIVVVSGAELVEV